MSTQETSWGASPNAEATEAWDGPLYDRFVQYRHLVVDALASYIDICDFRGTSLGHIRLPAPDSTGAGGPGPLVVYLLDAPALFDRPGNPYADAQGRLLSASHDLR